MSKNPDLCERAFCRTPWRYLLSWWDPYFGGRSVKLRVCGEHAEPYLKRPGLPDVAGRVVVSRERDELQSRDVGKPNFSPYV